MSRIVAQSKRADPQQEYKEMRYRAVSDRIHRTLQGRLSPTREQVVAKLNRRRREFEERLEGDGRK